MRKRIIKFQAVLFGSFNFPAIPDTTVKLMTAFAPLGFMPQVMNAPDPMTGIMTQRIGLMKGTDIQVIFAPERIDFTVTMPGGNIEGFVSDVVAFFEQLEGGALLFSRVALVMDSLFDEMSLDEVEKLRGKLLPDSGAHSIEWIARWVTPITRDVEQYNVCFEAMSANGLMMIVNGSMQPLNGVKVMHDISTSHANTSARFNSQNLRGTLNSISGIIAEQAHLSQI